MATYNVGNIEVGIVTKTKGVTENLDKLLKKINQLEKIDKAIQDSFISINKLGNGLAKITKIDMSHITSQFDKISVATKTLNEKLGAIEQPKFGETATALNRLGNAFRQFDKLKSFDFRKMYESFSSLNRIITPFLEKLKESESSLIAMSSVLNNLKSHTITKAQKEITSLNKETNKLSRTSNKTAFNFNRMFNWAKIYWFLNYTKRVRQELAQIIKASIDFEETLNKFQVSFGEFAEEAENFASKLAYAFNLSRESLYDYMSTFNSMLKSLGGLTTGEAYGISKTLTQLALDYSSLFNVTVDSAMKAFQSVLSGQIRTIRSVSGIDVSENTIFQYYQELGGTKSIRQLSQLEKRLLRIYALERQMDALGAVGDLEKTVNSSSNVIKQLTESIKEMFVYLGNVAREVFNPLLKQALAVVLVIKEMAKAFADLKGYTTIEYDNSNLNKLFGGVTEDAEEAEEAVDNLLGKLSFDKFEALSKKNETSVDLESIVNAIALYQTNLQNVRSEAREIADSMLSWLGYRIDEETGSWVLGDGYTNIQKIVDSLRMLLTLGVVAYMSKLIYSFNQYIISVKAGEASLVSFNWILGTILVASIANILINWDKLSIQARTLTVIITLLSSAILIFRNRLLFTGILESLSLAVAKLTVSMTALQARLFGVSVGLIGIIGAIAIYAFMDKMSAKTKVLVGVLGTLISTLAVATASWLAYQGAMTMGTAIPIILGSVAMGIASITALVKGVKQYKDGGIVEQGQMFIANEAGAELVGSFDGKTGVANNDMIVSAIEQASYRGFMRAMAQSNNATNVNLNISGISESEIARAIFNPMLDEAKRNGYKVNKS